MPRKRSRLYQGHAVPDFVGKFSTAIEYFGLRVRETANIKHTGAKGDEREVTLAERMNELLPFQYQAGKGEVVDLFGKKSPQLDVLIYDKSKNFPFYEGETVVIPAEALLCSVEVKSKINPGEIKKSQKAAFKLKSLRPLKRKIGTSKEISPAKGRRAYRYLHSLFAYDTNFNNRDWASKELKRLEKHAEGDDEQAIDMLYVLGRGLIDTRAQAFIPEDEKTGQALIAFWFALYNFADRENRRRERAPYFSYATDLNRFWTKI